jgi:hypothetical protein
MYVLYVEGSGRKPLNFKYRDFPNIMPILYFAKFYSGLKLLNRKTDNSAPSGAKAKNMRSFHVYMASRINYFKLYSLHIILYHKLHFYNVGLYFLMK